MRTFQESIRMAPSYPRSSKRNWSAVLPAISVAVAVAVAPAVFRYFYPQSPRPETANLKCTFEVERGASPADFPASTTKINEIKFNGELSGKSVHEGTSLWSAHGIASFQGNSQELAGSIFMASSGKVEALSLYRDRYPNQTADLRISTLNNDGKLDSNERSAFVYFTGATNKMAHPYSYRCNVIGTNDR